MSIFSALAKSAKIVAIVKRNIRFIPKLNLFERFLSI
jgi:hypothetical protein